MRRLADRLSHRTLTATAATAFALAGASIAYAAPLAASHDDGWFAAHNGNMTTGLMLGLFTSYVGVHIAQLLTPRKDRKCHGRQTKTRYAPQHVRPAAPAGQTRLEDRGRRQVPLQAAVPQPVQMPDRNGVQPQRLPCPRKL